MSALFIKLLNMSIAAGWLVLAIVLLRFAFKKAPGWVRCAVWALVALRLALPFSFQSALSIIPSVNTVSVVTVPAEEEVSASDESADAGYVSDNEPVSEYSAPSSAPSTAPGEEEITEEEISFEEPESTAEHVSYGEQSTIAEPVSYEEQLSQEEPTSAEESAPQTEYVSQSEPVSREGSEPVAPASSVSSPPQSGDPHAGTGKTEPDGSAGQTAKTPDGKPGAARKIVINTGIAAVDKSISLSDVASAAAIIWAAGVFAMAAYAVISYVRLKLKVRESVKRGEVYICDAISSPFVFGFFKPRIYVPSGMDEKNLRHVLAHEKAHIKRLDHIWRPLGFALLSVYWFAPLIWIAYILFCRDIEIACDEKVIRSLNAEERSGYTQALLDLSRPHRAISACPVAFGETGVKERVKKVFNYKRPALWMIVTALLLCAALCACMMTDPVDESSAAHESGPDNDPAGTSEDDPEGSSAADPAEYDITDYRSTFFTDPAFPDTQLCHSVGQADIYPMFSVEEEILTGTWDGGTGLIFKGKWYGNAESPGGGVCGFAFHGNVKILGSTNGKKPPYVDGKLIYFDDGTESMVFAPSGSGIRTVWLYDTAYTNEESDYVIFYNSMSFREFEKPYWSVMDREGNVRSLPVADEYRWYVTSLAFDKSSGDPNAVTVTYLDGDTEKTVSADLGSTRVLEDTASYYCKRPFVPGKDIEIPDFLFKSFKELGTHPVAGTLNIYTCDEFDGAKVIFRIDSTSNARIQECFVMDREYTDPASDYALRVYGGRRFTDNGDGTYRAKTVYAVMSDLAYYPQYFEEEPAVYGKLVIVEYKTEYNGEKTVTGRRVFAPGLENDPDVKYYDQVYTREGSDYILVKYTYYCETSDRPCWIVFDRSGNLHTLPVPAEYRWNVDSIAFNASSDNPDDVTVKYVVDDMMQYAKADLNDTRILNDPTTYYARRTAKTPELIYTPIEGSEPLCTCDKYPGKTVVKRENMSVPALYVLEDELFTVDSPDGTTATAYNCTYVMYNNDTVTETPSYLMICGGKYIELRGEPQKLGDNLIYCPNKDDGFIKSGNMYFIMDSHFMGLSCFGEPGVRDGVDGVFFMNEYPDTAELGEWMVIGKDGVPRSLPELGGKRYLIKDIAFDPAYSEGGRVKVTAYRWNTDLLGYEEFSYDADLASCRAAGLEYYGLGVDDLYGNYTFKKVYPEVDASSVPQKAGYFELDAFPGYTLLRTNDNRVIKFIKQFDDEVKWERDGKVYTARGYDAEIYGISGGKLVHIQLGSAVICGDSVEAGGYDRTVKYHNLFISSEFYENVGKLCYSYDPSGSGRILSVEYGDFQYGRESEFILVAPYYDTHDSYDKVTGDDYIIVDWQGCTYSLEGDGKPFAAGMIEYNEKSLIVYSKTSFSDKLEAIAFEDLHRDDATNYDLISVDASGKKPEFPGKTILYGGADGEYPFYVVDKELFTLDWDGKTATGFEGRFVEYAGGKVKTSRCFGVACGDKVCRFNHKGASLYAKGKLAIYEDKERSTGYVLTGCGEFFEKYRFETISVRDGADCVILNDITKSERMYPASMIIGLDGRVRSLPVSNDIRWKLIRLEFNYASDDPGDVAVYWYKYFTMHASANEFPSYRIGNPFSANVKDTVPVEYAEYYTKDPAEHWDY